MKYFRDVGGNRVAQDDQGIIHNIDPAVPEDYFNKLVARSNQPDLSKWVWQVPLIALLLWILIKIGMY